MFIFAIRNEYLLERLARRPFLNKFFTLRLEELDSARDRGVVDQVYKSFYVENGTSKETSRGRFSDLDEKVLGFLKPDSENLILDVGVSSGITSLDLFEKLVQCDYRFSLSISDKFSRFYCAGSAIRRIYDRDNVLARAYVFSMLADKNLHWKYFVSKYSYELVRLLPFNGSLAEQLVLYDRRVRNLIEQGRICEVDYDVFSTTLDLQFDFVRCMNLLNRSYFSPPDILKAIDNLNKSLKEGGILQIGSTNSAGVNNVSFFRKVENHLEWLDDVNAGSEIKGLIV